MRAALWLVGDAGSDLRWTGSPPIFAATWLSSRTIDRAGRLARDSRLCPGSQPCSFSAAGCSVAVSGATLTLAVAVACTAVSDGLSSGRLKARCDCPP